MGLKYNGIEPTKIIYNGNEVTKFKCNDIYIWAKPFKLSVESYDESDITINRISSQYGNAFIGTISKNDTIYLGDILQITGNGDIQEFRVNGSNWNSGDTIEVNQDISIYLRTLNWRVVWSGSQSQGIQDVVIGMDSSKVSPTPIYGDSVVQFSDEIKEYLSKYQSSQIKISGYVTFLYTDQIVGSRNIEVSFNDKNLYFTLSSNASITFKGWGSVVGMISTFEGLVVKTQKYSSSYHDSMLGNIEVSERASSVTLTSIKLYR